MGIHRGAFAVRSHLAEQRRSCRVEGDHGLAPFPDLVQRLFHDLIDLQGVDGEARKARQRSSRSARILVQRVRLGSRRLNFIALIDHFPVADRLRPAHEGLNVK